MARRRQDWRGFLLSGVLLSAALTVGCSGGTSGSADSPGPSDATGDTAAGTTAGTTLEPAADANEPIGDEALPELGDRDIDVEHYALVLNYEPATGELDGEATLDVVARRPIDEIVLDLTGLDVDQVTTGDEVLEHTAGDGKVRVELPEVLDAGQSTELTVTYAGVPEPVPTQALGGVEVGWQVREDASYVLAEPEGSRSWFPVNDHPTDKATYDITVTVPLGTVAIANGVLVDQTDDEVAETSTFAWEMDEPMAPYLATVVTGDYTPLPEIEADGVRQTFWTSTGDGGEAEALLETQREGVELLVGILGPFPFSTYAGVLLPPDDEEPFFEGVAIETQSVSLYGAASTVDATLIHETAHQWFGNSVSITDWSRDIWWVEGFARYSEWLLVEAEDGVEAYDEEVEETWTALLAVERPQPAGELGLHRLFSTWSYDRGGLTFAALRAEIGDEAFFDFLRAFVDTYAYGNATTEDLIATAEEVSGEDLEVFFDAWLYTDEMPAIS